MRCPSCGVETLNDAKFCPRCGYSFDPRAIRAQYGYAESKKSGSKTLLIIAVVVILVIVVPIVLAAVLYVLVLGFGGVQIDTPAATYIKSPMVGGQKITILGITKTDVSWNDIRVQVSDGAYFAEWGTMTSDLDEGAYVSANLGVEYLGSLALSLSVTDISGNGCVSGGDFFVVTSDPAFSAEVTYSACLIFELTGERIGTGISFTG